LWKKHLRFCEWWLQGISGGCGEGRRSDASVGRPVVIARDFPVIGEGGITQELCTIRLIDILGILEPKAQTFCGQLSLAVCGAVDWNAVNEMAMNWEKFRTSRLFHVIAEIEGMMSPIGCPRMAEVEMVSLPEIQDAPDIITDLFVEGIDIPV
uniref:RVP_2 domain-containing protein n=1 Tax=Hymenolepis diminuta TaxID=6216 RepID=A0A0R3SXH8_HYMDI